MDLASTWRRRPVPSFLLRKANKSVGCICRYAVNQLPCLISFLHPMLLSVVRGSLILSLSLLLVVPSCCFLLLLLTVAPLFTPAWTWPLRGAGDQYPAPLWEASKSVDSSCRCAVSSLPFLAFRSFPFSSCHFFPSSSSTHFRAVASYCCSFVPWHGLGLDVASGPSSQLSW